MNTIFGNLNIPQIKADSLSANFTAPAQLKSEEARKMFSTTFVKNESSITISTKENKIKK